METQDKELLYKALCGYLPYGVKVMVSGIFSKTVVKRLQSVDYFSKIRLYGHDNYRIDITENSFNGRVQIKPYLRQMSSMTEEEKEEYDSFFVAKPRDFITASSAFSFTNWMYEHHIDFIGLIEKGLALEAPEEMYND